MDGTLDGTTKAQVSSAGLKVDLSGTGANSTAVKVDGSAVTQPVSYATTGSGTATGALRVELPTNGTGVIATVSSVTALGTVTPGTSASNLGKAEDAAHSSGDVGVMSLSVRQDTAAATSGTDGDYQPLITDSSGRLHVNVGNTVTVGSHAVTNAGTFATQSTLQTGDNTVGRVKLTDGTTVASVRDLASNDALNVAIVDGSGTQITSFGGGSQYAEDAAHSSGDIGTMALAVRKDTGGTLAGTDLDYAPLQLDSSGNLRVNIAAGANAGGTSATDGAAFTASSSAGTPVMGEVDEVSPATASEGAMAMVRATTYRAMHVNLRDSSGNEIAVGGGTQYTEDAAAAANPVGTVPILVRTDTPAGQVSTDGDNVAQRGTNYGAAYVTLLDTGGSPVSVGGGTQYTEDAAAAANPIGNALNLIRDDARGGTLVSTDGDNVAARGTNYGELYVKHVDTIPVTQSGTWTVQPGNTANTTAWKVDASSVAVPVTDNSGSLTVDNGGTFAVQATVAAGATNIAKAEDVASADADVGVPAMAVRKATPANTSGTDGDYEMLQMSAGRLWTSSTIDAALPAGTNAIGKLASNTGVTIGAVEIASSQTLSTVTTVSTVTNQSQEGGVNISLNAGAVDTGTRRVVQANGAGKTISSAGGTASTSGNNTLISAGTNKLKVFAFSLSTTSTTAITCIFQSGASGTELWRCVLQAPSSVSTGANLSVAPPAWLFATASATLLNLNLSSANTVHWSVSYFDEA